MAVVNAVTAGGRAGSDSRGSGQPDRLDANIVRRRNRHAARDDLQLLADRDVAFEVAAERGHHREPRDRQAVRQQVSISRPWIAALSAKPRF
jgi:hypothetical protein